MKQVQCVFVGHMHDKIVSPVSYWVYGNQLSKTQQSGQRNFITQQQLQMPIVLLFKIDEKSYQLNFITQHPFRFLN